MPTAMMCLRPAGAAVGPLVAVLAACWATGCSSTKVHLSPTVAQHTIESVAVLDFEATPCRTNAGWLRGSVVPQESGKQVAAIVAAALSEQKRYCVLSPKEVRRRLAGGSPEAGEGRDEQALASLLGVDAVVAGRVDVYQLVYTVFVQRSQVRCTFWCTAAREGECCWAIEVERSCLFGHERELAEAAIRDGVRRLCRKLAKNEAVRRGTAQPAMAPEANHGEGPKSNKEHTSHAGTP